MPPPYTLDQVRDILHNSTTRGGHPYNHDGSHATTNFQNQAELEEVVRYVLNQTQVYDHFTVVPGQVPRPYRYEATVCLAGLLDGAHNPYRCITPHHPVAPGGAIQAARIAIHVNADNMWYVVTFVPYTQMPHGMGGLGLGQLADERVTQ
jgi:hypothetical protein